MLQLVLAAPRSGSGKTTAACALLAALTARGLTPCAFKSGPDYIDPMFHRAVLSVESHNLDLFFSAPQTARALYARHAAGHGAAVVEGAMGYYDGLGGVTDTASAWQLADTLDLPALLVVRPKGASLTLAAELRGLTAFRTPHHIAGILLNDCTQGLCALLKPMLEKETGLPVVGCLPPLPEAAIESRHLGLKTAAEIDDLQRKIQLLSDAAQQTIDWPLLHTLFDRPAPAAVPCTVPPPRVRLAVARDAAFCFTYAETLEALRENGAELCFFSPLADTALPDNIGGLYLPGGYPELYAARLAANAPLRAAVKSAVQGGLPTVADDSGLCTDALHGAPGVYSARYAGHHGDDDANNAKLLRELADVPEEQRGAKFVSAVCFMLPDGRALEVEGECPGRIAFTLQNGDYGFGYDPLFIPDEYGAPDGKHPNTERRSYAQLTPDEKDAISHRGRAMEKLEEKLPEFLG